MIREMVGWLFSQARSWATSWLAIFHGVPEWARRTCFVCYASFVVIAFSMSWSLLATNSLENGVMTWVHDRPTLRGDWAGWLTAFGHPGRVRRLCWASAAILVLIRKWQHVPAVLLGVLGEIELNSHLQAAFGRPRPAFPDIPAMATFGYPSGHTGGAVAIYGFWILFLISEWRPHVVRKVAIGTLALLICAVAMTRVALIAHWPTDVVGGLAFGTSWILFCFFTNQGLFEQAMRQHRP